MKKGLVSIVMPNYNGSKFIAQAINSVIAQTYQNWELIIVDDCSTDNSVELISSFLIDKRIKLIQHEFNQKIAAARNTAIAFANGAYIAFLDSDDRWLPNKLELQLPIFTSDPNIGVVFSYYSQINEQSIAIKDVRAKKLTVTFNQLLSTNYIGCLSAIYSIDKLGKRFFIEHSHEDYILWLTILKEGYIAQCFPEVLAEYRIGSQSFSSNKFKAATWQWSIYRNVLKISMVLSAWYFLHYVYYGLKKHA